MFLSNKKFIFIVCAVSFVVAGLIFSDRVLGLSVTPSTTVQQPLVIPAPTNTSPSSPQAVNVSYLNSAGYLNASSNISWNKLTGFPSSCYSGQYVSGIGSSLTCSTPSSSWFNLTNFPSSCSSGQYVSAVGSSLTCSTPSSSWSNLTNFPSSCSSGQYVSGVGSSLTCSTPSNFWIDNSSYISPKDTSNIKLYDNGDLNAETANFKTVQTRSGGGRASFPDGIDATSRFTVFTNESYYSGAYFGIGVNTGIDLNSTLKIRNGKLNFQDMVNLFPIGMSSAYGGGNGLDVSGPMNIEGSTHISGSLHTDGRMRLWGSARNNDDYTEPGDLMADDGIWAGGRLRVGDNATIYGKLYLPGLDGIYVYGSINDWYGYAVDFQDDIDMHSNKIKGLATPSYSDEAANKSYVDSAVSTGGAWVDNYSYISPKDNSYFRVYDSGNIDIPGNLVVYGGRYSSVMAVDSDGIHMWNGDIRMWSGGNIYTTNLTAVGNVGIGTSPSYSYKLYVSGDTKIDGTLSATTKNFVIPHPLDPENKQLVHSTLEGSEIAVFYRGEAQLQNGRAIVELPNYFEALTRKEGRTVLLTPKFDSLDEPVSQLAASAVVDGKFQVKATDSNNPSQKFYWEVKAVRADVAPLEVERIKK